MEGGREGWKIRECSLGRWKAPPCQSSIQRFHRRSCSSQQGTHWALFLSSSLLLFTSLFLD